MNVQKGKIQKRETHERENGEKDVVFVYHPAVNVPMFYQIYGPTLSSGQHVLIGFTEIHVKMVICVCLCAPVAPFYFVQIELLSRTGVF